MESLRNSDAVNDLLRRLELLDDSSAYKIREEEFIGWHFDTVKSIFNILDIDYRVMSMDGIDYILTSDFDIDRLNISVNEGIITDISLG